MTVNLLLQKLRKKWPFVAIALAATAISFVLGALLPGNPPALQATKAVQVQNLSQSTKDAKSDRTEFNLDRTLENFLTVLESKEKRLTFVSPQQFQGTTIFQAKVKDSEKVIALTVDDGPWPETTEQMLDIFKQNNVKATFFGLENLSKVLQKLRGEW